MKKSILLLCWLALGASMLFAQQKTATNAEKRKERKAQPAAEEGRHPCCDPVPGKCACENEVIVCFDEYGRLKYLPDLKNYSCVKAIVFIDTAKKQLQDFRRQLITQYEATLEKVEAFSPEETRRFNELFGPDSCEQFRNELRDRTAYLKNADTGVISPGASFLPSRAELALLTSGRHNAFYHVNNRAVTRLDTSGRYVDTVCFQPGVDSLTIRFTDPLKKLLYNLYSQTAQTTVTQREFESFRSHVHLYQQAAAQLRQLEALEDPCSEPDINGRLNDLLTTYNTLTRDPLYGKMNQLVARSKRWLWLTGGKPLLNPFGFTSPDRFIATLTKDDSISLKYQRDLLLRAYDSLYNCCHTDFKYADELLARRIALEQGKPEEAMKKAHQQANEKQWTEFLQTSRVYNVFKLATGSRTYGYLPDFQLLQYDAISKKRLPTDKKALLLAEPGKLWIAVHNVGTGQEASAADYAKEPIDDQNSIQQGFADAVGDIGKLVSLVSPLATSNLLSLPVFNGQISSKPLDVSLIGGRGIASPESANKGMIKMLTDKQTNNERTKLISSVLDNANKAKSDSLALEANGLIMALKNNKVAAKLYVADPMKSLHQKIGVLDIDRYDSLLQVFEATQPAAGRYSNKFFYSSEDEYLDSMVNFINAFNRFLYQRKRELCEGIIDTLRIGFHQQLPTLMAISASSLPPNPNKLEELVNKTPAYRTVMLENPTEEAPFKASQSIVLSTTVADSVQKKSLGKLSYKVGARYHFRPVAGIAYTASPISSKSVSSAGNTLNISTDDDRFRFYAGFKFFPAKQFQLSDKFSFRRDRWSVLVALGIPKPLENYYLGIGVDPIPGFFFGAGMHLYTNNRYTIANNTILETRPGVAVAAPAFFIGIDPATFVKSIGLFGSKQN